jgi:cephalosporin-C deacetylase-like acetyl esterase
MQLTKLPAAISLLLILATCSLAAERKAEWTFDEGQGDQIANVLGGPAGHMAAQWAKGPFGTGVYFSEAPGDTVLIPDSPAVRFGKESFTISLWLCPTKLAVEPKGQYRRLLAKNSYPGTFWTLDIYDTGRVMFAMKDDEGHGGNTVSKGAIPENVWTHLTIIVDRQAFTTTYIFDAKKDSVLSFPKTFVGALDVPGKPIQISTWRKYVGLLETLTLATGVRTQAEIAAEWRTGRRQHQDTAFTATALPKPSLAIPLPTGDAQTMWDMAALSNPPKTYPAPDFADEQTPEVRALFYDGVPYQGKPTRVFAWYGVPKDRKGKVPAMVLVHGGGGTAFKTWVETWNKRGYAAIAMDTCGGVPRHPEGAKKGWQRHDFSGPNGWGDFDGIDKPIHDQWTYHAVAAVVLGHSLLRSMPEVDPERIGLTGISWGGYLTNIVSGVDPRFKFASPVYGCGFLGENSSWVGRFRAMGIEKARKWLTLWDPSQYVVYAKLPMLFCDGTNDHFYPLDSLQKTYRAAKGPRTLVCKVRMVHAHPPAGDPPEITDFANHILRSGPALPEVTGQGRNGANVWATFKGEIKRAELCYTKDKGNWEKRRWEQAPAELADGRATAALPEGTTVYFMNLIDARDHLVSTEHEDLTLDEE